MTSTQLNQLCCNTIRFLSADAIQRANSGHPGMPMGAAASAYILWDRFLKHNPRNPSWPNRDRFVLSAGHASMLIYSMLHLTGYDLTLEDIKNFRQWQSKTPGHPECGDTPGVEITTGPLGQGISHAVGMAVAEAHLAAVFNRPDHTIVDHFTYAMASDGDLMEGVASEACSLAGHLKLGKLIVLYDDNRISLAGSTSLTFTEDVNKRFEAYGWQVQHVNDGNDLEDLNTALENAKLENTKPSLISIKSIIGFGAPHLQNTHKAHGSPLGDEELAAAKKNLDWPENEKFYLPDEALDHFRKAVNRGEEYEQEWDKIFEEYEKTHPELAKEFNRRITAELPENWEAQLPTFSPDDGNIATRKASEVILQALAPVIPELFGGSADLNPSTLSWLKGYGDFQSPETKPDGVQGAVGDKWSYEGQNIHFGVREHAMGAIANGIALHGGIIPYTATFFTFSDYMRPSMRLAALMGFRVIYIFSHDSIGLGEDGPTHQPVEQLMSLRCMPNLTVIRPADANETSAAWQAALKNTDGPTALVFTRQKVPTLDRNEYATSENLFHGAYILWQSADKDLDIILIASGSEVSLALDAGKQLANEGKVVRVVSMPSWELFEQQSEEYKNSVLPSTVDACLAVEAGVTLGWERYVGQKGAIIGVDRFGASAPADILFEKYGFTTKNIVSTAESILEEAK